MAMAGRSVAGLLRQAATALEVQQRPQEQQSQSRTNPESRVGIISRSSVQTGRRDQLVPKPQEKKKLEQAGLGERRIVFPGGELHSYKGPAKPKWFVEWKRRMRSLLISIAVQQEHKQESDLLKALKTLVDKFHSASPSKGASLKRDEFKCTLATQLPNLAKKSELEKAIDNLVFYFHGASANSRPTLTQDEFTVLLRTQLPNQMRVLYSTAPNT